MTATTGGRLVHINRHPIKGHGREALTATTLTPEQCLPFDRVWAVAHEWSKLTGGWVPCANFSSVTKTLALSAMTAMLDEATRRITLTHPDLGALTLAPDDPAALPGFLDWIAPLQVPDRPLPTRIVSIGRGITDSDFPSVSVLSMTSLRDLSARMGQDLSIHRWRGNLWLDGADPWAELTWIGRRLSIGATVLEIREPTTRCKATTADPSTGLADADTLTALRQNFGHQDFGVYAMVLEGGPIALGDEWTLL
jgi:uncharacterized protein